MNGALDSGAEVFKDVPREHSTSSDESDVRPIRRLGRERHVVNKTSAEPKQTQSIISQLGALEPVALSSSSVAVAKTNERSRRMQRSRGDSRRISARETEKGKGREHNVGNKRSEEPKQTRCSISQPASSQRRSSEHVSSSWSSGAVAKNTERGRGDERRSRHHSSDRKAKHGNQRESYVVNEIKE